MHICTHCHISKPENQFYRSQRSWCKECVKEKTRQRSNHLKAAGLCTRCGKQLPSIGTYCERCWFHHIICDKLGKGQVHMLDDLIMIWKKQGQRCPYTGEVIRPGDNMSLDHIIPVCRGGSHKLSNLQWITHVANNAKSTLTHEEFLTFCARIVEHTGATDKGLIIEFEGTGRQIARKQGRLLSGNGGGHG